MKRARASLRDINRIGKAVKRIERKE